MEANYLNTCIYQRLSVSDAKKDISTVPILLTSTSLAQSAYQDCLHHFKKRLGLKGDQDLYVLINVTMSPWPTTGDFIGALANDFRAAAEEEMLAAVYRNVQFPHFHGFVMQGVDNVCGVHLPMFNMENHRTQLIISCDMPSEVLDLYRQRKAADPNMFFTFGNKAPMELLKLIYDGASFEATVQEGFPSDNKPISDSVLISNVKILLQRSLHSQDLSPTYPDKMVFYAYGRGLELHMDHLLNVSPNIQLNSERIRIIKTNSPTSASDIIVREGAWLRLSQVYESAMQPLTMEATDPKTSFNRPGLPFIPGSVFHFEGFDSESAALDSESTPIVTGTLVLGPSVFADTTMLNADGGAEYRSDKRIVPPDARSNGGALASEYPNPGGSVELRNRYQSSVVQGFREGWSRSKHDEAQKRMQSYTGEDDPPAWLKALLDHNERAKGRKSAQPVRMYHTGMH